jgi:hypothetical protein
LGAGSEEQQVIIPEIRGGNREVFRKEITGA